MINLLIVDDEPLVQAGLRSMLDWKGLGTNIIGTATNGAAAFELIKTQRPDICISDIKMPVMDGLELIKKCREELRNPPLFIMLTSYEEFRLVKEAIKLQAFDYLVKLDITPQKLRDTIERALAHLAKTQSTSESASSELNLYRERFYICLINNLFESEAHYRTQCETLGIALGSPAYCACHMNVEPDGAAELSQRQRMSLYASTIQMMQEITAKYIPCQVISLDISHFAVLFFLSDDIAEEYKTHITDALSSSCTMLHNYYGVSITSGVGRRVTQPTAIAASYAGAKYVALTAERKGSIVYAEDHSNVDCEPFNMSLYRENIMKAYCEYDSQAMRDIFDSIIGELEMRPSLRSWAMDAASNILYLSLTLFANGEKVVSEIFADDPDGYRSLYHLTSVSQIAGWMRALRDGLCASFESHRKSYKCQIVAEVKQYIRAHTEEKLTLNNVSGVFNISPNYLSHLFSKYNDIGFVEYINSVKIDEAKLMLREGRLKIYEIANKLGFENAFYFSRVFKKTVGLSPSEFLSEANRNGD